MFRVFHFLWGTAVCLLLVVALASGYKVPEIGVGSGTSSGLRGSGGSWGFGGGK